MSVRDKSNILAEIKRTAQANGGMPLGRARFLRETGIKSTDWMGKYWIRWGDALQEAGYQPNQFQEAYNDSVLVAKLIEIIRELGHFPVTAELRLKAHNDPTFPSHSSWGRLGPKQQRVAKVLNYCKDRSGHDDVVTLCTSIAEPSTEHQQIEGFNRPVDNGSEGTKAGYVYMALLKLGREKRYKIGKAILVERRKDQISIQLPEDLELVHSINTDDAYGIEDYWQRRFAGKNTKGEWFVLSREDIEVFKRRKFM
jgi:hypothetical protein